MMDKMDILGVQVDAVTVDTAGARILEWIKTKRRAYVCVAPVSTLIDCQFDAAYREIINGADMVTPDGMPVVWLAKLKGHRDVRRTYGPDLMRSLCSRQGLRHYFYGSTPAVLEQLTGNLSRQTPGIEIVGTHAPGFLPSVVLEDESVIAQINRVKPDILWVGLGSPKQDFWMKMHRSKLDVPVIVGVGAAFDFLAGTKSQAPRWVQNCGMEWFFRLICEPGRLWKRYLIGNTLFIYFVIKDLVFKK